MYECLWIEGHCGQFSEDSKGSFMMESRFYDDFESKNLECRAISPPP